ncbi:translation initiation factor 2 [Bradyrhizobium sp.]|uniref:translation initiation factor 2 n=1 Tax=Bradyrhizobium sp. TaxID=376 RepID=UPI003C765FA3
MTRGTTENISISSTPAGAEATISGLEVPAACITPCAIVAKRSADLTVSFAKEGFEPEIVQLTKEVPATGAAGFAGNILAGGLVGMGVDAVTGAAQDHKPNPVIVTLKPIRPLAPPAPARPRGKPAKRTPEAGT